MAYRFWPDGDPTGKRIRLYYDRDPQDWVSIVGVADVRYRGRAVEPILQVFVPYLQNPYRSLPYPQAPFVSLVVRTAADPAKLITAVQARIWAVAGALAFNCRPACLPAAPEQLRGDRPRDGRRGYLRIDLVRGHAPHAEVGYPGCPRCKRSADTRLGITPRHAPDVDRNRHRDCWIASPDEDDLGVTLWNHRDGCAYVHRDGVAVRSRRFYCYLHPRTSRSNDRSDGGLAVRVTLGLHAQSCMQECAADDLGFCNAARGPSALTLNAALHKTSPCLNCST
jgi:hypothetical protein